MFAPRPDQMGENRAQREQFGLPDGPVQPLGAEGALVTPREIAHPPRCAMRKSAVMQNASRTRLTTTRARGQAGRSRKTPHLTPGAVTAEGKAVHAHMTPHATRAAPTG